MKQAIDKARKTMNENKGGPFGAAITDKDGNVVVVTSNLVLEKHDPTAHAEVMAIRKACEKLGADHHEGVVQCKDSFYGQHRPETLPNHAELETKWDAWCRMGCKASEMESAALFICAAYNRVRCGSCFLAVANQERARLGLPNPQCHDTELPIRVAIEALKELIQKDQAAK